MTIATHLRHAVRLAGVLALLAMLSLAPAGGLVWHTAKAATAGLITVSGVKYNDLNNNGVRDQTEPGLPGWTIYIDLGNTGQYAAGDPFGVTDASGAFTITANVDLGTYSLREIPQANWVQTAAPPPIVVPPVSYTNLEFGNHYTPPPSEVPESDTLWLLAAGGLAMILYLAYRRRTQANPVN